MDKKLVFQILGISETKDEDTIRQSYLRLLKDTNPEDDPEGFKRLREAYEEAVRFSKMREADEEQEPQGEVEIWMSRVAKSYRDIFLRREPDVWKELFDDPVCVGFDTFLEAREKLLAYISAHPFLPQSVWKLIDQIFHVLEDFETLKEDFHVNFLNHIDYHVHTEDFLNYEQFEETERGYTPDEEEDTDGYFREYFRIRDSLEQNETEGILQALSDLGRYGLYHPYEDVERLRLLIRTKECDKGRELAEKLIERYPEENYVRIWTGKIFYETGEEQRGYELWQAVLSEEPDYYMAKYYSMHDLMRRSMWYQAHKYLKELIKVNRYDEELQGLRSQIAEAIIPELQAALSDGKGYEELSKTELVIYTGWRLFDLDRNEEALSLLDKEGADLEREKDYCELRAWLLYSMERYEEAVPYYQMHIKSVASEEDEEKRAAESAQSHLCLSACFYELGKSEEGEKEARTGIAEEPDFRIRLDSKRYLAGRYLLDKQYENAVELCDEIIAEDEDYYPAYLITQESCFNIDKAQQVVDDYYRAIELYAGYDGPYLYAAKIFYDYEQYENAKGVIERARENQVEFTKRLSFEEARILRRLAQNAEDRQKAREILEKLLGEPEEEQADLQENKENTPDRAEIIFEMGLLYYGDEETERAVSLIREAIELDPDEPWYHLVLGNILRDTENYKDALTEYQTVEDVYHHAEMYFGMGVCHEEQREWTEAIKYYEKVIEQDERYRDTNRRLYECYESRYCIEYRKSDYEKALFYINKQLEINEDGYRFWNRAYLYNEAMETELALSDYQKALSMVSEEDRYIVLQNIGYTYKGGRQFEKAYEAFSQSVECMEPKNASVKGYDGMAECSMNLGEYERAIACCKKGLEFFPDSEDLWDTLRDCYEETDRFEEALEAEKANREHGESIADYYHNISFILLRMGKIQESIDAYEEGKKELLKCSADKDELADLYENLGDRYESLAEFEKAAEEYKKSVALRKEDDFSNRFNCEYYIARDYYLLGDYEQAAHHAKNALKRLEERNTTPEDYMTWPGYALVRTGIIGWIYLALGEKEKGKKCLEDMETMRPCKSCEYGKCYEASLWLGYYYFCEKEYEKAAELMEETLKRNFDALAAEFLLKKLRAEMEGK
ncbi:MAG: tetratricopeptide repeat protein [Lachnospiraceae bacterium]|nr:tetratricopeptide repeat protein [Lachnospiraceae bacterium]